MLMLIFLYLPVICSICLCLVTAPRLSHGLSDRSLSPAVAPAAAAPTESAR